MTDELTLLYDEHLPGGGLWSGIIRRNRVLRLTDSRGGANVSLMAWNAAATHDRMNLPDTLKAQYTAKLTRSTHLRYMSLRASAMTRYHLVTVWCFLRKCAMRRC